jgi:nucleoside-diphosphate-sugar epimerase
MKIAITGHSAGIGQALAKIYAEQGHEIIGLSRRNGYNIRSLPKVAGMIEPCDMFINNAQAGFTQTELLVDIWNKWKGQKKFIINISTAMTQLPVAVGNPELNFNSGIDLYRIQKLSLEETCKQLGYKSALPMLTVVKPGAVATHPDNQSAHPHADPTEWAETLVKILDVANPNLYISEISLGVNYLNHYES